MRTLSNKPTTTSTAGSRAAGAVLLDGTLPMRQNIDASFTAIKSQPIEGNNIMSKALKNTVADTANTEEPSYADVIKSALTGISESGGLLGGHDASLKRALVNGLESYRVTNQADALESAVLDMLSVLSPDKCGKDGYDNRAYRTFTTTLGKLAKPIKATEECEEHAGYNMSIKLEKIDKANKDKNAPRQFVVGAEYVSLGRFAIMQAREADDKVRAEAQAIEDSKLAKAEEIETRASLPQSAQDELVLDAIRELFPNNHPLDVISGILDRATTDNASTAETA